MDDFGVVSWQIGRPARALRRVVVRCAHGFPAVTEQEPYADDGQPFPTTYYLTCPWLVSAVSRLEADGGVRRFAEIAASDPALAQSLERADAEQRAIRPELDVGIGGSQRPAALKCLHAHAAYALARPGYDLGERILTEAGDRWCPDGRCARAESDR